MLKQVRVMVLAGNGTNCEAETAHACRLAGADVVDTVFIWDLASGRSRIEGYDLLCFPGGFMDGDDLGSAKAAAVRLLHTQVGQSALMDQVGRHIQEGGLVIGICNGFQLLIKLGLLPMSQGAGTEQEATLTFNDSGRFEDRWVDLVVDEDSPCVFTKGIRRLEVPVRHGEGKIVFRGDRDLKNVISNHLAPVFYARPDQEEASMDYPHNPNGSTGGIAGLCDPTGRIFGLMPHPEAFWDATNHPDWRRKMNTGEGAGLAVFRNAVSHARAEH